MSFSDVLTAAVLAFIGVRIASGTRIALGQDGRRRVRDLVRGLRPHHFLLAFPALTMVIVAASVLVQVPGLDLGWWSALGGVGNPVTGGTDRTAGTALEWIIPLVFIVLLLPALPLFAEAEERMFRLGSENRTPWGRAGKAVQFGLMHALIGIPIGVALALSVGGAYFTWRYLVVWRRTFDRAAATAESTRTHLAYNAVIVTLILVVLALDGSLT